MAIDIRSRASRKKSEAQAYATTDPGRSRGARIGTAALIALAALWQAFVLREAQSAESEEDTAAKVEDLQPEEGAPAPVLAVLPRSVSTPDDAEPAGSTQPISSGIQAATVSAIVPDWQSVDEGGGGSGGNAFPRQFASRFDLAMVGGDGRAHAEGVNPVPAGPVTATPSAPKPDGQTPSKPTPGGEAPTKPTPGAETPTEPAPGGSVPTTPVVDGQTTEGPLPYGLDALLADLAQIVAPQSAEAQAAFLETAVDDWLSAARLDSLRRGPETFEGAMDWESYARDRQQIAALENPTARDAYLARFLPGGVDGEALDSPSDQTALSVPDPFSSDIS